MAVTATVRDLRNRFPQVKKLVEAMSDAIASFNEDLAEGRYSEADVLWRRTLRRASELSRIYTPVLGCRSLDLLHVATALELGLRSFVTFDDREQRLARAAGLKTITPTSVRSA